MAYFWETRSAAEAQKHYQDLIENCTVAICEGDHPGGPDNLRVMDDVSGEVGARMIWQAPNLWSRGGQTKSAGSLRHTSIDCRTSPCLADFFFKRESYASKNIIMWTGHFDPKAIVGIDNPHPSVPLLSIAPPDEASAVLFFMRYPFGMQPRVVAERLDDLLYQREYEAKSSPSNYWYCVFRTLEDRDWQKRMHDLALAQAKNRHLDFSSWNEHLASCDQIRAEVMQLSRMAELMGLRLLPGESPEELHLMHKKDNTVVETFTLAHGLAKIVFGYLCDYGYEHRSENAVSPG